MDYIFKYRLGFLGFSTFSFYKTKKVESLYFFLQQKQNVRVEARVSDCSES